MPKLIRSQKDIPDASTEDLVFTYNELTGKTIKKFSSRGAGEAQVANAILAAEDAAGHRGVAKGEKPKAMTLREQLAAKAGPAAEPNSPKPKAAGKKPADAAPGRKPAFAAVTPTDSGSTKVRAESQRGQVLALLRERHKRLNRPIRIAELDEKFGSPTRGHIFKLIEGGHVAGVAA